MAAVPNAVLQQYVKLTEFLGQVLGPSYEVALHDLTNKERSIIAIANNHISGREVGAPLTNMALSILKDKSYETSDYRLHYYGVAVNGKDLQSSTLFIKDRGRLIGMLCINFDDSRYRSLSNQIMGLCHPDIFWEDIRPKTTEGLAPGGEAALLKPELFGNSPEAVTADAISRELKRLGITADRLTAEERLRIIAALDTDGIFLLKGAVKDVAAGLHCSQASVYRYLSQLKDTETA
ncbi:transcriptional regulator [uncultured Dysosmobacter sp.]|uniref:helix-turn-helix transcriptional regulator n=1 Tax=uncultured Dysosmobacter sp. TaxID=2591384 RepID=UPI0026337302|nr:PAS domain-containing protein [uncultured Dysosmobacter sp.]